MSGALDPHAAPQLALWAAVAASGVYHGLNPAMGWPLAVSNALMARRARALVAALGYLALGHALAVFAVMLPFGLLAALLAWQATIRIGASAVVIGFGIALLMRRQHPRALARIAPARLGLWSFAIAIAHGAGLMLVPIYLGLCGLDDDPGHRAAAALAALHVGMALTVAAVHAAAMIATGGALAWLVYRYVGLAFVSKSWFNLDAVWASSLIVIGALSLGFAATQ
ncbi:hypothetical protein [Burkholderia multivorans]|uniref:hypothetical protein n=1 Tax=Burkholderia multivorans TaxID=87883 RepID=UPI000F4F3654|nr:hypothetical protein [Burkholderia multivorans]AYY59803.1 hypothetical protein EGY20_24610 [Burkholderia multivorans]MBU9433841.1 hypothetical protein [Burkholderia multivorans]MCA8437583.1 hypothetical protein [Burkholderia multivorans]